MMHQLGGHIQFKTNTKFTFYVSQRAKKLLREITESLNFISKKYLPNKFHSILFILSLKKIEKYNQYFITFYNKLDEKWIILVKVYICE